MTRYAHTIYSFETLVNRLSDDKDMLNYLVAKGSSLDVVAKSDRARELLMQAFNDETVRHDIVSTIFNIGIKNSLKTLESPISIDNVLNIIEQFKVENPTRLDSITRGISYTIRNNVSRAKDREKVFKAMVILFENAKSEELATVVARDIINTFNKDEVLTAKAFPVFLATTEKFLNTEGSITLNYYTHFNTGADLADYSGNYSGSHSYCLISSLTNIIARMVLTSDAYEALERSPISRVLNMTKYLLRIDNVDGSAVMNKIKNEGLTHNMINALQVGVETEETSARALKVFGTILEDETFPESYRRLALASIILYDHDRLKANMSTYNAFLVDTRISENYENSHLTIGQRVALYQNRNASAQESMSEQIAFVYKNIINAKSLSLTAVVHGPLELLPTIYNNANLYGRNADEVEFVKNFVMTRIHNESLDGSRGKRIDSVTAAALWECLQDYKESHISQPEYTRRLMIALIESYALPETILKDAVKMRGGIAKAARAVILAEAKLADAKLADAKELSATKAIESTPESNAGWDSMVNERTSFGNYLDFATGAGGYTLVVAFGLYSTDTRIELKARVDARRDFISFLGSFPHHALEIPESVWSALLRVREPLELEMGLVVAMNNIGGAAARVVSKNLTKASLL